MMKREIALSAKGITNAGQIVKLNNDFTFTFGEWYYKCPKFLACFISPKLCELLQLDPTISSFDISMKKIAVKRKHTSETQNEENLSEFEKTDLYNEEEMNSEFYNQTFSKLIGLIKGKKIEIEKEEEEKLLVHFALELGNGELLTILKKEGVEMKVDNVIERLTVLSNSHLAIPIEEEIGFIAEHFTEFNPKVIQKMSLESLDSIMSHPNFVVRSENWLYDLIRSFGKKYDILLSYVQLEYLNDEKIKDFIEYLEFEQLNISIWKNVCNRSKLHLEPRLHQTRHVGEYIRYNNDPFNGIFSKLNRESGKNCIENKTVEVTFHDKNSNYRGENELVNYSTSNYLELLEYCQSQSYCPGPTYLPYIIFDFKNRAVKLCHYSLKSGTKSGSYLMNWVIEGSNNDEWTEIDQQTTRDLCGCNLYHTYACNCKESYKKIRIRLTGNDSNGTKHLQLKNIEFFGQIYPVQQ
ncbi:hypothetical protein TRFO_36518 [Tritrichomonas foetus]|uniref:F5/8 type C domain-containing protein n=1 Tax=Tritrichomonas foetus TaxID=1144522 RepID=A0A1J4JIG3_9EUKA|nr:hypothetical protein TRFO_36518 [Tritrichomonas foetus]|eukprot:OHS97317.1 hypothetical protein TRFO_36518 [Tritrichomonas foetus]